MPRLRQVPKDEATAPIVTTMYEWLFEGRDPVTEPGRWDGTTGDWWTVFANSPDILDHCVKGFGLCQSPDRILDPTLRELGQIRAGYAAASQFVFSQHAKSMRELGMPEEQITHIPAWSTAPDGTYNAAERAVLAYTDCLVYDLGRVPDGLFAELRRHLDDHLVAVVELGAQGPRHDGVLEVQRGDVGQLQDRLVAAGIPCTEVANHDDSECGISEELHEGVFVRSVYFQDPDGILLEFACWMRSFTPADVAHVPATAPPKAKDVDLAAEPELAAPAARPIRV